LLINEKNKRKSKRRERKEFNELASITIANRCKGYERVATRERGEMKELKETRKGT